MRRRRRPTAQLTPEFAVVSIFTLVLAIAVLASYLPARRASNVDPIESLRGD